MSPEEGVMLESRIQPNDDVGAGEPGRGITTSGST